MKIYIGSLQYSPIYKSHCCALGRQLEKQGHFIKYLFSENYYWMLPTDIARKTLYIGKSKDVLTSLKDGLSLSNRNRLKNIIMNGKPDYVYMHNIHPVFNYYISNIANNNGINFIQHIHEPYVKNKKVYKGIQQYWLCLFENIQERLLKKTDVVILSSNEALTLFDRRYPGFQGKKVLIPLLYEDSARLLNSIENRKYIIFIGPPVPAKGPEIFLEIADYAEKFKLGFEFILITRQQVKDQRFFRKSNLKIFYKSLISDEEIGDYFRKSIMTITPYKTARQSSVILISYMYGTPVLSSNVGGLPEVVNHQRTGYLLDVNSKVDKWIEGIKFIKSNLSDMSKYCRDYFVSNYSEENWPKYFKEIFSETR